MSDKKVAENFIIDVLDSIPIVYNTKEYKPLIDEVRYIPIESIIRIDDIVKELSPKYPDFTDIENTILALIILMSKLGWLKVYSKNGVHEVTGRSESSSSLIRNVSYSLKSFGFDDSELEELSLYSELRPLLEDALEKDNFDINLFLANKISQKFEDVGLSPLQSLRIRSLLIKGKNKSNEYVYLHIYKRSYKKYALIGSRQLDDKTARGTIILAIRQDLKTTPKKIHYTTSGVNDVDYIEQDIDRGLFTRYWFNFFFAHKIDGELVLRDGEDYRWFTLDEIKNGESADGNHRIMTRYELLKQFDDLSSLSSVPCLIEDVENPPPKKSANQLKEQVKIAKAANLAVLSTLKPSLIYIFRWFLGTALVIGIVFLGTKLFPLLEQEIPILEFFDTIFGIVSILVLIIRFLRKGPINK